MASLEQVTCDYAEGHVKGPVVTNLRKQLLSAVDGQFGRPHGLLGQGVAIMLNRGDRSVVEAAVQPAGARAGEVAADIDFGGELVAIERCPIFIAHPPPVRHRA